MNCWNLSLPFTGASTSAPKKKPTSVHKCPRRLRRLAQEQESTVKPSTTRGTCHVIVHKKGEGMPSPSPEAHQAGGRGGRLHVPAQWWRTLLLILCSNADDLDTRWCLPDGTVGTSVPEVCLALDGVVELNPLFGTAGHLRTRRRPRGRVRRHPLTHLPGDPRTFFHAILVMELSTQDQGDHEDLRSPKRAKSLVETSCS